jgi:hypothetical protein
MKIKIKDSLRLNITYKIIDYFDLADLCHHQELYSNKKFTQSNVTTDDGLICQNILRQSILLFETLNVVNS